jgi:hypothetical protein
MTGGLPRVAVQDLVVEPRSGDLVVGTHGRSIFVAEAAPLRKLKDGVASDALHAFPVKTIKESLRRGYGENPWTPFFRIEPTVRIAYWTKNDAPVKLAIKDENGMLWKELDGTSRRGMNVVEYDLSADAKLADPAEAKAREKALAKEKEKEKEKAKDGEKKDGDKDKEKEKEKPAGKTAAAAKPASDEDEDEEDDTGKPEEDRPSAGPPKPLDPETYELLADPLRATRKRYLPPGKYTIEVRSGGSVEKTTLKVDAEKETSFGED